jgi:hypothetical protein
MTNLPEPTRPPAQSHLRASDTDRERVVKVLGDALADGRLTVEEHAERLDAVYVAKTMGELEPITYDLAVSPQGHPQHARQVHSDNAPVVDPTGANSSVDHMVAIFGGVERKGRWRVRRKSRAIAIFGGADLDLTDATFDAPVVEIEIFTMLGGIDVTVPEGVVVRNECGSILGGVSATGGDTPPAPGAPVVVLKGLTILGGADIHPPKRRKKWH